MRPRVEETMNGNNLISLVRWPQRFLVTDRHWSDLWAGKRKATPLPPGAKQHVSNRALKQTRIPSMAELMFMGKDIFFPVFIRTTLTLKLRKPGAFRPQCEG